MYSYIRTLCFIICIVPLMIACGGGGGGGGGGSTNTPTDTSLVFSLFPPGYFGGSYSDSFSLTGSDSDGDGYSVTLAFQSGSTATFNAQPVMTIDSQVTLTNTTTNAVASGSTEGYYSTDVNNLTFVGNLNLTDGVSAMATSTTIIPLTGSIGDFGNVGSYTMSDGTSSTASWALQDGFNGMARMVHTVIARDGSNALDYTEIDTYTISQDGTISRLDIVITYHQFGNFTITLSGS